MQYFYYSFITGIIFGLLMFFDDPKNDNVVKYSVLVAALVFVLLYYLIEEPKNIDLYIDQPNW